MAEKKKNSKRKRKKILQILLVVVLVVCAITGSWAVGNEVSISSNRAFVRENMSVVDTEKRLSPVLDENGNYTFTTDEEFKILHITDVHIGGGLLSSKKDNMALNAVGSMIKAERPDLVVVSGDVAYPVPYQAGTFNNKESAKLFAEMMERLGIYWCLTFGNHDTEVYSYFSRETMAKMYSDRDEFKHCLLQPGPEDVDGVGNYVINIKNSKGEITQSIFLFDSHSYVDGDYFGIKWKYDCVHENQVTWYRDTVTKLTAQNRGTRPNSLAFFHIPPQEMRDAYEEYKKAGMKDTDDVKVKYGKIAEGGELICCSNYNYGLFNALKANGTQGVFFGHDHLNNMSLNYKGVQLTYGYSIDYLAYGSSISKFGLQRGCTVITVKPDGSFENKGENYYQDKYVSFKPKETVDLEHEMSDVTGGISNPLADE